MALQGAIIGLMNEQKNKKICQAPPDRQNFVRQTANNYAMGSSMKT